MHLSEDDLCSTVSIGDVLDIVGQANYCSGNGKNDAKLLGDVQVPKNVSCVPCKTGVCLKNTWEHVYNTVCICALQLHAILWPAAACCMDMNGI